MTDKIQKIREWVKARLGENTSKQSLPQFYGMMEEDARFLDFLDSLQEEPKKCMYARDNYTDEDRKALCDGCEEDCKYAKLNTMLDDALSKETKESLNEWLDKKDFRERYKRIAQSESFKKAHGGISIGDVVPVEGEEPVGNDFEMALAEMIHNAQTSVVEPLVVAAQWKDELIKLAKSEEPVSEDLEKIVEEIAEPTILNAYGTKELARRLRNTICGTPVSEDLEEAAFDYAEACKYDGGEKLLCVEHFKAGAQWQKHRDNIPSKDLEELINKLSCQFPEVSFAKLSRIAVRVSRWQRNQDTKNKLPEVINRTDLDEYAYQCAYDMSNDWAIENPTWHDVENACKLGANWQKENLWKSANGDDLPEYDREVIVLINYNAQLNIHDEEYPTYRVGFGHRPNPDGWDGKNIDTNVITHYTPKLYDKGGWNAPNIVYWLDARLPYEENKIEKEIEL